VFLNGRVLNDLQTQGLAEQCRANLEGHTQE
jgi:hypothetical protein